MPTYQYRCTECGHDLEAVQKFTDAALTECPNCGGPLRKVFNAVGVVFKGSGFYRTDSRKDGAKTSTDGPAKDKGASGSGDKKPATAPAGESGGNGSAPATTKQPASTGTSTATKA